MGVATSLTAARMLALEAQTVVGAQREGDNIFLRRFNNSLINLGSFKGETGMSAYQIAVANGYVGSVMDWVDSLQGADGEPGASGISAYQVAVNHGFVGTEAAWLSSLKGNPGIPAENDFILAYQTGTPDMNNYKTGGAFALNNTATNGPIAAAYGVLTVRQTPDDVVQQFQLSSSPYTTWTRRYNNILATWTPWRCLDPVLYEAKAIRATDGPTVPADTYTRFSGFSSALYNDGDMINLTSGDVTIPVMGRYTICVYAPWRNYGSVYRRFIQINKNSTTATANILKRIEHSGSGRKYFDLTYRDDFLAGDVIRAWLFSDTASNGPEVAAVPSSIDVYQTK